MDTYLGVLTCSFFLVALNITNNVITEKNAHTINIRQNPILHEIKLGMVHIPNKVIA